MMRRRARIFIALLLAASCMSRVTSAQVTGDQVTGDQVTGGYVYRANPVSSFNGVYIFGDYNTRRVSGLRQRNGKLLDVRELGTAPGGIAAFGIDDQGELLLVTYGGLIDHLDLSRREFR